jgi:hypothetical protein
MSCPLASRRWIAAALSSRRLTLRMASVHAPSTAVAVTSDAITRVMARYPTRWHACAVSAQLVFRFLFETASHGFVRPCDHEESGQTLTGGEWGWLGPASPRHCVKRLVLPRVPGDCGTLESSARAVLPGRLNDGLSAGGSARPNLGLRRWDDPSGWVGTEPGPTVSSFADRASHSLPNS